VGDLKWLPGNGMVSKLFGPKKYLFPKNADQTVPPSKASQDVGGISDTQTDAAKSVLRSFGKNSKNWE